MKRAAFILNLVFLAVSLFAVAANPSALSADKPEPGKIDTSKLKALKPRSIGPATMSGRVTAIAVDPRDVEVIYVGTASGGLWRSVNGGTNWQPIFEDQGSASIGAVAVDPHNPDLIWVGTGEGNPRNSQSVGDGLYKSLDRGRTWKKVGLEESEHIHRILIHPRDSDVVYVGAVGPTWSDGEQRGVFKTVDGGATWEKVLYVDERTGVGDLVMDPANPDKLIAAMWEHRRSPSFFKSGGPGSGIHVTYDGGENWEKLSDEHGLPKGELGRVGLAIAPSNPDVCYALVEAKKNALYRSEDGGHKWSKVNDKDEIGNRPFYYWDLRVDPRNENRLYSVHSLVSRSEDGGKSFKILVPFAKVHSDHHAFWINPDNPEHMIDGNDGGMAISRDGGETWRYVENLPVGQFYHINVDMETPYNIYGGLQDNGSFMGPSQVWQTGVTGGGILNSHWKMVSFGDGFDVVPDPSNSRYGYSMSQGGNLYRFDKRTGETKTIRPPAPEGVTLRFNWNAGIAVDPFEPTTVYYGSQFLHRSRDRGESWEIISPDLTTNDPERQKQLDSGGLTYDVTNAENNTTITAIAPSPLKEGVIWVGTDDGNVQVTRDGGGEWTNVIDNIPGVPKGNWVPHIEASKFQEGGAFVVFDDHRRGNWTPYAFKTSDYGASWTSLITDNIRGYVYVIEQDPTVENLLFLGTEFHLYFSIDGGQAWTRWDQGYPTVPTMDLAAHPRDPDLVIGTFGRAIWIMDDISALRAMARQGVEVLSEPLRLFEIAPAYQAEYGPPPGELIPGDGAFIGQNRPRGALLTYVVTPPEEPEKEEEGENASAEEEEEKPAQEPSEQSEESEEGSEKAPDKKKDKVKIEILQGEEVIRTLEGSAETGLNRMSWRLDRKGVRFPSRRPPRDEGEEPGGIPVLPGSYTVRVSHGEMQDSQPVTVLADPRIEASSADMQARSEFFDRFSALVEKTTDAAERLRKAKESMGRVDQIVKDRKDDQVEALREQAKKTREAWKKLDEKLFSKEAQGIRRDPEAVTSKLFRASSYARSSWDAPNATEKQVVDQFEKDLSLFLAEVDEFFEKDWNDYKNAVKEADVSLLE